MIGPAWLDIAYRELRAGVREIAGGEHHPRILKYGEAVTLKVTTDEIHWCSNFTNFCIEEAGLEPTRSAAARSWLDWGVELDPVHPAFGAVLIFARGKGRQPGPEVRDAPGHVNFFWGHGDPGKMLGLGGNQGDAVTIEAYPVHRLLSVRWPGGH